MLGEHLERIGKPLRVQVIEPNILIDMIKLQNYAETEPFQKLSTPEN